MNKIENINMVRPLVPLCRLYIRYLTAHQIQLECLLTLNLQFVLICLSIFVKFIIIVQYCIEGSHLHNYKVQIFLIGVNSRVDIAVFDCLSV